MMSLIFVLSAALWVDNIFHIALVLANEANDVTGASAGEITLFNALVFVSLLLGFHYVRPPAKYVMTDGIVVWRTWAIHPEMRAALRVATTLLVLTGRE
jgi:hypothetical protein